MSREPEIPAAATEAAAEALRHLWWLRDSGVREVSTERPAGERAPQAVPAEAAPAGTARAASPAPALAIAPATGGGYARSDKGCGSEALLAIRAELGECTRCKLHGGRTHLVFGVGNPSTSLVFVGEGPGADEDQQGEPFVGRAGQLLTKMIEAMGFARSEVYIANVVKCRPPGNRDPEPDEIEACEPFLKAQIAAIRPRVIVALGRFAVQTLLQDTTPISRQRGRWREYEGVKLMPTFHPAYLLRNPAEKKPAWEDLQLVMKEFGKSLPPR
jgi:uracil-DNA glycosylase